MSAARLAFLLLEFGMLTGFCAAAAGQNSDDNGLQEIVVTATRRETSLEKTPLSVSAFSAEALRDSRIADLTALDSVTPGVTINGRAQGAGNPISIRGVGSNVLGIGADDAVAIYSDGVYQGRQYGAISQLPDVDRIEVLRGPQGTLYGRNATGGAISVVSLAPSVKPALSLDAGYGKLNESKFRIYGTTGLWGDKLAVSFGGSYKRRDGYSHNAFDGSDLNDEKSWIAKMAIRYLGTDNLDATIRLDSGALNSSFQAKSIAAGEGDPDRYDVNFPGEERRRFSGASLDITYDFPAATLTSITAYRKASYHGTYDSDGTPADLFRLDPYFEDQHQFSQEFRFTSRGNDPLQWLLGLYYFDENASGTVHIPFIVFASDISLISANHTRSYAGFGEISYQFTDKLKMTLGARYSKDKKTFDFEQVAVGIFPSVPKSRSENDAGATTPKLVIDYQLKPEVMAYVSASRGFKSGGFSAINPLPFGSPKPFFPERLWAYEIGLKSEWFERRLRWNNAAFYYDYKDLQVRASDQFGFVVIQNAASAKIKGVESELVLRATPNWNVSGNLAFLDAKYSTYVSAVPGLQVVDESGKYLNRAPRWSTDVSSDYTWTFGNSGSLTGRAEYSYKTTMFYTEGNVQPFGRGPTGELKARLTYRPSSKAWSVSAYGDNLTDRRYRTSVFDVNGQAQALYNLPRLYGIEIHVDL